MTRFGSVCSGIEAASVAFAPLGWQAAWFSEIEAFPCKMLATHYPDVPNFGDMRNLEALIHSGLIEAPDVLCGGTPCQSFSFAGLRKSLDDVRGNLTLTFCRIANAIDDMRDRPAVILWENVPGVLNTKDNAFGFFLAGLAGEDDALLNPGRRWPYAGVVYGPRRTVAWRTLDAQYFGLAQRRKRVFVVASARDDFDPTGVLFEFEGMRRDSAPSREAGAQVAGTLDARAAGGGFPGTDGAVANHIVAAFGGNNTRGPVDVAAAVNAKGGAGRQDFESETFVVTLFDTTQITSAANRSNPKPGDPCHPLAASAHPPAVAFDARQSGVLQYGDMTVPLDIDGGSTGLLTAGAVRRLMPVECERLQGFEDEYTAIGGAKDGPRYKAIGNSWAVPCVRWIGERMNRQL